jgi:hypothetical protein
MADTKNRVLELLAEIGELVDNADDLSNADSAELMIDMAEQAIKRLGDDTEEATYDEDAEAIKRSFEACDKMIQELQDIKEI